jgi:hypothetical protein
MQTSLLDRQSDLSKARRPDGGPIKMSDQIICDRPSGVFRPCICGGTTFIVAPGAGPHIARLICSDCPRGGRWLSRQYFGATP